MKPGAAVIGDIDICERDILNVRLVHSRAKPLVVSSAILRLIPILLAARSCGYATVVASIWAPGHVMIAVDGKVTRMHTSTKTREYGVMCKVIKRGPAVYVPVGLVHSSQDGFDLVKLIDGTGGSATPSSILVPLRCRIESELKRILPRFQKEEPRRYAKFVAGDPILTVFIAFPNPSGASLNIIRFKLSRSRNRTDVTSEPSFEGITATEKTAQFHAVGPDGVDASLPSNWYYRDHGSVVRSTVETGIRLDSERQSGPPISIVRVMVGGVIWIDKGHCSENGDNAMQFHPLPKPVKK